jgi:hypothetical protein
MIFNPNGHLLDKKTFHFNTSTLEIVQNYTYLGINIPCSGNFEHSMKQLLLKGNNFSTTEAKDITKIFGLFNFAYYFILLRNMGSIHLKRNEEKPIRNLPHYANKY